MTFNSGYFILQAKKALERQEKRAEKESKAFDSLSDREKVYHINC